MPGSVSKMGRKTPGRKARLLLRWLKYTQLNDSSLSGPVLYCIRYTLKYNKRCNMVVFDNDDPVPHVPGDNKLPAFLYSQLDAQNIANDRSLWRQVKPLLQFVRSHLPQPGHKGKYPTLFGWHSEARHHTFWFFAFIEIEMESRVYAASELLGMRNGHLDRKVADNLRAKVQSDSELGTYSLSQPLRTMGQINTACSWRDSRSCPFGPTASSHQRGAPERERI